MLQCITTRHVQWRSVHPHGLHSHSHDTQSSSAVHECQNRKFEAETLVFTQWLSAARARTPRQLSPVVRRAVSWARADGWRGHARTSRTRRSRSAPPRPPCTAAASSLSPPQGSRLATRSSSGLYGEAHQYCMRSPHTCSTACRQREAAPGTIAACSERGRAPRDVELEQRPRAAVTVADRLLHCRRSGRRRHLARRTRVSGARLLCGIVCPWLIVQPQPNARMVSTPRHGSGAVRSDNCAPM
jgi:hypothetical protein